MKVEVVVERTGIPVGVATDAADVPETALGPAALASIPAAVPVAAGTPVMATVGMLNTTSPGVRGGMEASAGDVSGTGTKPAATRLATSNPAAPPISLPIAVSSPAS